MNRVLHVGCGGTPLPPDFPPDQWEEVRLDINPDVKPDIVASITDMSCIDDASYEALYSSHNLEHLYAHEVPAALNEFRRVLKPGAQLFVAVPDLQAVAEQVAGGNLTGSLYESPSGPVAAIDILFGFRICIVAGNGHYCHRTGFTADSLLKLLGEAGFREVQVVRHLPEWALHVNAKV